MTILERLEMAVKERNRLLNLYLIRYFIEEEETKWKKIGTS